ncbi:MAG: polysaccharide deacetylase family protein [Thermoleophilia bacterium]
MPGAELGLTRPAILAARSRLLRAAGDRGVERTSRIVPLDWRAWHVTGCRVPGTGLVRSGVPGGDAVGLSFDDGPAQATATVLDMLRAAGVHATFYVIGRQVSGYPPGAALMRRALAEGDMLGNHSWQHAVLPAAGSIAETQAGIVAATGFTPCTFRPPYGRFDARLEADVAALGMRPVTWDIDTRDWTLPGAAAITAAALRARPGDIILMHDGGGPRAQTVAALSGVLDGLRARGLRGVTVEDLLGATPVYRYG